MDIATIIGIIGGVGVIFGAIALEGSSPLLFVSMLATLVVFGGATTACLIRYPMHAFVSALTLGLKEAFVYHHTNTRELIDKVTELAEVVRRQGPLGLESVTIDDPFLAKGAQMIADGYTADVIRQSLERERDLQYERLDEAHRIFRSIGEAGPGMGMVGTLIGLVSMFSHMDDPKKIGPGMAIALTATLYGAVLANLVALPISDKLSNRANELATNCSLVIDAVLMIRESASPAMVFEQLLAYLPLHHRGEAQIAKAA